MVNRMTQSLSQSITCSAVISGLLAATMSFSGLTHAANPEFEVIYIKPGAKPVLPKPEQLHYVTRLRAELKALESRAALNIEDPVKAKAHFSKLQKNRSEAEAKLEVMGPLWACRQAAYWSEVLFSERMSFQFGTAKMSTALLVQAAQQYAENIHVCRTDIERYQALMKPSKR